MFVIFVVYKSECAAETVKMTVESQTDRSGVLDSLEQSMQTESTAMKTTGLQTDHTQFQHAKAVQAMYQLTTIDTQTVGVVPVCERSVQVGAVQASALVQTDSSMARQRDGQVQATVTVAQMDCQTVILCEERGLQTEVNTCTAVCQTVKDEKNASSQTVVNRSVKVTQTAMSMAYQKDQQVQAVVRCAETNAQTTISMALQADRDVQAVVDTASGDCQTSVSMALEVDKDVQAVVTSADSDCQTHIDHIHRPCQTTVSMAHEEHKNVQATAETEEGESQTENTMIESSSQATVNSEETDTQTQPSGAKQDPMPSSPSASQESRQTNSEVFTSPDIPAYNDEPVKDEESQTDPVTIIIGDASILLEKLKGSTSNKVTTNENEIEIEVHDVASLPRASVSKMSPVKKKIPRRSTGSKYMKQFPSPRTPATPQNAAAQTRRRSPVVMQDEVPFVMQQAGVVFGTSSDRGKYSCPFCTLTFHESPTLYEHLQNSHVEKCKSVKKPKGREGKTIVYREPMPAIYSESVQQEELDPPVLVPVVPLAENQAPEDNASEAYEMEPEPLDAYTTAVADTSRSNFTHRAHPEQAQHEVQKFACSECGKIFDEATQLQTHLKVVHDINSIIEEVEVPNNDEEEEEQVMQPEPVSTPVKRKHSPVMSPTKRRRNDDVELDTRVTRSAERMTPNTRSSMGGKDSIHGSPQKAIASPPKQERQLRGVAAKK